MQYLKLPISAAEACFTTRSEAFCCIPYQATLNYDTVCACIDLCLITATGATGIKKQIGLLVLTSTRLEALTNRYPEKPAYKLYCLTVHHTPSELPNLIEKIIDIAPTYQSAQSSN